VIRAPLSVGFESDVLSCGGKSDCPAGALLLTPESANALFSPKPVSIRTPITRPGLIFGYRLLQCSSQCLPTLRCVNTQV
jgi:hypothetical protein